MSRYPNIAAELYESPWMMWPARYHEMCAGFERVRAAKEPTMEADDPVGPEVEDFWTGEKRLAHPQIETFPGSPVALAKVHGVTGKGLSRMSMQCGGFDTGLFREQIANVRDDKQIKVLVIDFNSPGGMVPGTQQVAEDLRALSAAGTKVIGYTSFMCCSAAYWMASACDEFHAERDAIVGSISTIWSGVDSSKAWEKNGLELKLFSTGKFKATGMPGKEWTKEEEDQIWSRIRPMDELFKGFVAERRGLRPEDMEGQWWYACHAPRGVVDSTTFGNLNQVLEAAFSL